MEPIQATVLEHLKSIAHLYSKSTDLLDLPIIIAYSGGLDSSVLLHACYQLQQQNKISRLAAAHVNHGIQQLNNSWEQHCMRCCEQYQIELHHKQFALSKGLPVSENEARKARYDFFEKLLTRPAMLLFAHHLDDQVETMLFRMIRGTGVHGLSGIPKSRQLANGWLARPLIDCTRSQLEEYANRFKLNWVDDPSNQQSHYSRNYLRNNIIPKIESKWPEFSRAFKQLSEVAKEQTLLMDEVAAQDIKDIEQANSSLIIKSFNLLSKVRRKNLLHYWVRAETGNSPTSTEIDEGIKQLEQLSFNLKQKGSTSTIKVKLGQGWLRSFDKHIYYLSGDEPFPLTKVCRWNNIEQTLNLDNGVSLEFTAVNPSNLEPSLLIRRPRANEIVTVQPRQGGESARPSYRAHRTDLKKIFQELKVPPWKREWLPIIYFDEKIACIPGVFVEQSFKGDNEDYLINIQIDSELKALINN